MKKENLLQNITEYFNKTLENHGTTPRGVDWNSEEAREARFDQLIKIADPTQKFTILDYGCGYGAFLDYLKKKGYLIEKFYGFDISDSMIHKARELHPFQNQAIFSENIFDFPQADFATACGVFNMKQNMDDNGWTDFVITSLMEMDQYSKYGFSVNFLTKYSDPEKMRDDLYYADPGFYFDFCKRHFSKNVAILHDYGLYDFTILVRKNL